MSSYVLSLELACTRVHDCWAVAVRLQIILFSLCLFITTAASADTVDFSLRDLDGVERKLSDYRGKWVIINFWATWCAPCLQEIPELIRFHDRHKDNDAVVLGINFEEIDTAPLREFVNKQGMNYPVLRVGDTPLLPFEPLKELPSTFFVTPQGAYVHSHVGPLTYDLLEDFLIKLTYHNL